jgi:hypothetical protein
MYDVMSVMQPHCFDHKYFSDSCIMAQEDTESRQYTSNVKERLLPEL